MNYSLIDDITNYVNTQIKENTQNNLQRKALVCQLILRLKNEYGVQEIPPREMILKRKVINKWARQGI